MAKCATCAFHEKDKRMEKAWFLANYNEAKNHAFSMRVTKRMENARGTFGPVLILYYEGLKTDVVHLSSSKHVYPQHAWSNFHVWDP